MAYYKVLAADGCSPYHGGSGKWFVPVDNHAGEWMPEIKNIELCARGYHVVTLEQLPQWIGPTLYEVEIRGKIIAGDDKSVAEQARLVRKVDTWNDKTLRLFAADCAERVLELYEKQYPNDDRPRKAIQAARDFANGLIDKDAAYAASAYADAAAYAAYADAAAYAASADADAYADAAYAAAYAADAAYAAYAASAAASAAYAANAAADAAARKYQLARLKYYLEVE